MRRTALLLPLCLIALGLAGCGQKGPLVLPPTRPAPAPGSSAMPAPAASTAMPASAQS